MDKPSRLERWLTIIANLAVVAGIIFLALELRQNTGMMQAQIRDSITEKQMDYYGWVATTPETADVFARAASGGVAELGVGQEAVMHGFLIQGVLREFENSYYQYERGLFTPDEFEPRVAIWEIFLSGQGAREVWQQRRETYSPRFRAEIDAIVAEIEN